MSIYRFIFYLIIQILSNSLFMIKFRLKKKIKMQQHHAIVHYLFA